MAGQKYYADLQSKLPSKDELEKMKSKLIDELYQDSYIQHYLKKNNLDASFVQENLLLLLNLKEENEPCLHCKGYLECKQTPKGYRKCIIEEYDEKQIGFEKCGFYKDLEDVIESYTIRDFEDKYLYLGLNNIKPDSISKDISGALLRVVAHPEKGLYIRGKSGTGKTYLATALCNSLVKHHGMNACFINFKHFIEDCKATMNGDSDFIERSIKLFSECDVLVLDDVGGEKISDWSIHNVFYEIISNRMHNRKLTIFTSLYSVNELLRLYGGHSERTIRVIDCIRILADEIELSGINYFKI